jgi:DNA-binding response OmpR family regulator
MNTKGTILWVDDEIDLLRPHILFLREKGYAVDTATNGEDAIVLVGQRRFDLVLLDEMMPGRGGLETLASLKEVQPALPVVMVTKNEAESLMEEAIGRQISDYLTKPVNPTQVLLTCKKFIDGRRIAEEFAQQHYLQDLQPLAVRMGEAATFGDWAEIHQALVQWERTLDSHPEAAFRDMLRDQRREANVGFGRLITANYKQWVNGTGRDAPILSPQVLDTWVVPHLRAAAGPVFFFVIDCMRYDQWLEMEHVVAEHFSVKRDVTCGILPTATAYARNAIFSGLWPSEVEQRFPHIWEGGIEDDDERNKWEKDLLVDFVRRKQLPVKGEPKYFKIISHEFGKHVEQQIPSLAQNSLTAIVVNFVDMLAHGRSDSTVIRELAPDERAYRAVTRAWFENSTLFGMLRAIAQIKGAKVILTSDHGSIRCLRGSKVFGDRTTSTCLRFKYGKNVRLEEGRSGFVIKNPKEYKLPSHGLGVNYVVAMEDYFLVYPTDYNKYLNHYHDTFQHGGISLEEMVLPVVTLEH